jgi:cell division septation protein DedD
MERVTTYRIPAAVEALHSASEAANVPPPLLEPVQALVAAVVRRSSEGPFSLYICSGEDTSGARNDLAFVLARAVTAHVPSALLVDCDFMHVGLQGFIPQKDALGFLDFLLYGSSIGVITQEARGGVRVVGAGSFPVTKRMPFVETAFVDASRRLVAHARCVAFVGPLSLEDGDPHPLCSLVDAVAVVRVGEADSAADAVEEGIAAGGVDVWSIRLGSRETLTEAPRPAAASPPAPPATPPRAAPAPPPKSAPSPKGSPRGPARPATPAGRDEPRYTSLVPRLAIIGFGVLVIAFVAWWVTQDHRLPGDAPPADVSVLPPETMGTPGGAGAADTAVAAQRPDTATADTTRAAPPPPPADTVRAPVRAPIGAANTGGRTGGTLLLNPADIHVMAELDQSYRDWYIIHISSFQESIRAREEVAFLQSREFPVFIVFLDLGAKGKWYRVYAGPFRAREEAREVKKNLDAVPQVRFTRIAKIPE